MDFKNRFFQILNQNLNENNISESHFENSFASLGFDSITIINLIVSLESEFDFEFDDKMLLISAFPNVESMFGYVKQKFDDKEL